MSLVSRIIIAVVCLLTASAHAVPERHLISQKNRRFAPKEIQIAPGDVVVFQNDDQTSHHIMARSGPTRFSSRLLLRGASYEVPFPEEGKWTVGCRIHPRMRLKITVSDTPAAESAEPEPVEAEPVEAEDGEPEGGGEDEPAAEDPSEDGESEANGDTSEDGGETGPDQAGR